MTHMKKETLYFLGTWHFINGNWLVLVLKQKRMVKVRKKAKQLLGMLSLMSHINPLDFGYISEVLGS